MSSSHLGAAEEKTADALDPQNNNNNNNQAIPVLSWTNSEQDFGQKNFVRYETDNELVKLNADDDWNALVLYLRKEDIVAAAAGGHQQGPTVHARTFVYGQQDQKGAAKWRKVPLQVVTRGAPPVFAKSPVAATATGTTYFREETKQQEEFFFGDNNDDSIIPNLLSFGEGGNDPVKPLLRNDLQQANDNMRNLCTASTNNNEKQKEEKKEGISEASMSVNTNAESSKATSTTSSQLSLTKTQTIKALTYLKKVTEMRKNRMKKKNNNKSAAKDKNTSSNAMLGCIVEEHDDDDDEVVEPSNDPTSESIEVAQKGQKQRSFEEDQTALLDHACGLRQFCTSGVVNPDNRINCDNIMGADEDQEILFDVPEEDNNEDGGVTTYHQDHVLEQGTAPVLSIDIKNSEYGESILTEPTMNSPKKQHPPFPEQQRGDNMRTVMLKLLKTKKRKQHGSKSKNGATSAATNRDETDAATTMDKAAKTKRGAAALSMTRPAIQEFAEEEEYEESPLGKSSSSSFVEAKLAAMGYTKISEIEETTDEMPPKDPKDPKEDTVASSYKPSARELSENPSYAEESKRETTTLLKPLPLQSETNSSLDAALDPFFAADFGRDDGGSGVASSGHPLQEIEEQFSAPQKQANSQAEEEEKEVSSEGAKPKNVTKVPKKHKEAASYTDVAAVEVNYLPKKRQQRGRFKKRSKKPPILQSAPTTESMIRIEANTENSTEAGPTSLVALVRKSERLDEDNAPPKTVSGYPTKRRGKKTFARPGASFKGLIRSGAKGANSITTKTVAGNSVANEIGISGSIATVSIFANGTEVAGTQGTPKTVRPALSFDESKVRERVACDQSIPEEETVELEVEDNTDSRDATGTAPGKKIRKGFGSLFALKGAKSKEAETAPVQEDIFVEVCNETADGAHIEKIGVNPVEEELTTSQSTKKTSSVSNIFSKKNGMVKALSLSLSRSKSPISPVPSKADDFPSTLTEQLVQPQHGPKVPAFLAKRPAFLAKRPAGIDTSHDMHSYELAQNASAVSNASYGSVASESGKVKINPDDSDLGVEASLDMDTLQDFDESNPPPTMCCAAHASPVKKRLPSWQQKYASPASGHSSMRASPGSNFSPGPTSPHRREVGNLSPTTMFSGTVTAVTLGENATQASGYGANCVFFAGSADSGDGKGGEHEAIITRSQGDSDVIEVAKRRIEADEAHEKAREAAEYAFEAARFAEEKSKQANEKSTEYNARHHRTIGSFLLGRKPQSLPASPRSTVDPPAPKATVQIREPEVLECLNSTNMDHLSLPPPPPPGSPRRRRSSSPRRKKRTTPTADEGTAEATPVQSILKDLSKKRTTPTAAEGTAEATPVQSILKDLSNGIPPPPPPPPLSPRRRARHSKAPSKTPEPKLAAAAADQACHSSAPIKPTGSSEGRFGWIKSILPKSQKIFPSSNSSNSSQQSHRRLLGEDHLLSYPSIYTKNTGASATGRGREVVVVPDTYLI